MKKLLALILSITMLLTMFSGTLATFADTTDSSVLTMSAYDGTLPASAAGAFGFEDPSKISVTANAELVNDSYSGNYALKLKGGNGTVATVDATGLVPADFFDTSKQYRMRVKIKTTADFSANMLRISYVKDGANVWAFQYATGDEFFKTADCGVEERDWTIVTSAYVNGSRIRGDQMAAWATAASAKFIVEVYGYGAGTAWIDDISYVEYGEAYTGNFPYQASGVLGTGGQGREDGGFETKAGYYGEVRITNESSKYNMLITHFNTFQGADPIDMSTDQGQNGNMRLVPFNSANADNVFQGEYSAEIYKVKDAASYVCFWKSSADFSADKNYYLQAWVRLDNFNGAVFGGVGKYNYSSASEKICYTYNGENWMLGTSERYVTTDDVGNGWIKVSTPVLKGSKIIDAFTVDGVTSGNVCLGFGFMGTGRIYVDNFDLIEAEDNTPLFSSKADDITAKNYRGDEPYSPVYLTTAGANSDIWYTTDGTNPLTSATVKLYDEEYAIRTGDSLYIRAVGIDKSTGAVSDEVTYSNVVDPNYYSMAYRGEAFHYDDIVLADGDDEAVPTTNVDGATKEILYSLDISEYGLMKHDFSYSFTATASEDFTGEAWVRIFVLGGNGGKYITVNGDDVEGCFAGRDGYALKITEPGTYNVTVDLNGMTPHHAFAPVIKRISGSGSVTLKTDGVEIKQVGKELATVEEFLWNEEIEDFEDNYLDYYFDGAASTITPVITNNTAYQLNGTLKYSLTQVDGDSNYEGDLATVSIDAGATYDGASFDISEVAKKYGVYTAKYVLENSDSGAEYVLSEKTIAYLQDNSDADAFSGVNVSLFTTDVDLAKQRIDLLKKLGLTTVRAELRGGKVIATEDEEGNITYSVDANTELGITTAIDEAGNVTGYTVNDNVLEAINYAKEQGVLVNVLVNGYTSMDQFTMFATAIKDALGDAAEQYEIINEGNGSIPAATYAAIVKAVYPILKTENNKIMVGNVSHHGGGYLEGMIEAANENNFDIFDYIDIWAVHPYVYNFYEGITPEYSDKTGTWEEASFNEYIAELKETYLDPNGIELWAGEIGFPTADTRCEDSRHNIPCVAVEDSAEHTVRSYLGAEAADYSRMIHFVFGGEASYSSEGSYGIIETSKRTPIAAINAYTALTKGYTLDSQTVENGVYTQKYTNEDGEVTYAIWTTGESATATVTVPNANYGIADMYGNKEACGSMASTGDAVTATVTATTEPVYVVPFVDTYVEPLAEGIIKNGSMEGETLPSYDYQSGTFGYDYDKFIKYDGEQSLKMTFTGGAAGQVGVHFDLDMSKADLNKLYTIRFKYKTVDFDGKISITSAIANGLTYKRHNDQGEMFADVNLTATTDGWETYESQAIALSGTGGYFRYQFVHSTNSDATVWIDAVELVPVEGTGSEYGTITNPVWDADNNRMLVTVTPVEGYHVESVLAKGNNRWYGGAPSGWEQPKELVSEIVSTDSETGAVTFAYQYLVAAEPTREAKVYFTPYGIYQHLTATFAKGAQVIENNIIADGNCEKDFNGLSHCYETVVSVDKEVFYDGAGAYKMVTTATGGGVDFSRAIDMSDLDLNTTYKLRFKYKTEDAQLIVRIDGNETYNGASVINYRYQMYVSNLFYTAVQTENTTTDGWMTYESNPFSLIGDAFNFKFIIRNNSTAESSTIWFDRFELVPVDTADRHGKVTTSYDAENSRILVTATPEEGFEPIFTPQAQNHDNNDKLFNMKHELVSVDEATGAETYAVEFVSEDGATTLETHYSYAHKPYVIFKTAFVLSSIVPNGNMESGLPGSWDGAFNSKASIDTAVRYDGAQSMKLSLAAGANTNFTYTLPESVMADLDVSVQYKAVVRMKSDNSNVLTGVAVDPSPRNVVDGTANVYDFDYKWLYGGEILFWENGYIATEWTTYETSSFSVIGDQLHLLWPISNKGSEAINIWIDAIQIVPAEENTSNGVVTQTIDDNGNVIFTAKANEGYMLDTLAVYGTKAYADLAVEIDSAYVAQTAVDVVSYSANLAGYKTFKDKGYNIVKATFVEIPAANGDASGDGVTDITDLVKYKNFELGNINAIEYANVWYDRSDKVLGATDFTALKKQIWNNF